MSYLVAKSPSFQAGQVIRRTSQLPQGYVDPEIIKRVAQQGEFLFLVDYTGFAKTSDGTWITDSQLCGPSGVKKIDKAIQLVEAGHTVKMDVGFSYGSFQPISLADLQYFREVYVQAYGEIDDFKQHLYPQPQV